MKAKLNALIDYLQEKFPPNRVVVLLTPIIFVPVSAWAVGYAAKHFPGLPHFDTTQITVLMAAGALSALKLADKFIDGWQNHEARGETFRPGK